MTRLGGRCTAGNVQPRTGNPQLQAAYTSPMRTRDFLASLAACLLCLPIGAAVRGHDSARPAGAQRIFVTVIDAKGKPVTGLTKDDFAVRVDTRVQEIVSVEPAKEAPSVLILTDRLGLNSTYTPFDVGETLRDFTTTIRKGAENARFALTTFDGPVIQVATFASGLAATERVLGRLATNAEEAALLDGLRDACRSMISAPTERRIVLTLVAAYKPDRSTVQPETIGDLLRLSGASLFVVEVRQAQGGNYQNPVREQILDAGSVLSGGLRDVVSSRSGVNTATKRVADLVLGQYAVTFGPGTGSATSQLAVQVKREGVRVLAPRWLSKAL
jgi:hypothetical protein